MLCTLRNSRYASQFCKYQSCGHQSGAISRIVKDEYAELLQEIVRLGRNSEYKQIYSKVNSLPLHSIVTASIADIKENYPPPLLGEKYIPKLHACPTHFSYMLGAFTHMKSEKVGEMIAFTKTEIILADHVGSECLFDACSVLVALEDAGRSNKHDDAAILSENIGPAVNMLSETNTDSIFPDVRRLHSLSSDANPVAKAFIINYTQWLLQMSSSQRYHHTVNIMCKSDKNLDRSNYLTNQVKYLHDELNYLKSIGKTADFTAIGDVQLSGFTAARMFGKIDVAVSRLKNKLLHVDYISKEAFSLAIYGCISGKAFTNDPTRDDSKVSRAALNALLGIANGNTFQCIFLRGTFFNVMSAKGFNNIIIEYASKFRDEGLLISSRGCNCLISAYISKRDFPSAIRTLELVDFEENIVRSHGMKIFVEEPRPFQELEDVINRFTLMGKEDYNNNVVNKKITGKVVNNSVEITKEMQLQANLDKINNPNKFEESNDLLNQSSMQRGLNEIKCITPEFGVNLHSFMALIFSPYLNLVSRNYFSDKKNDVGTENVFFNRRKVADILKNLLDRMIDSRIQPDARFLSKVIQIGKSTGSNGVIFRVLTLAKTFYNSRNSWNENDNQQPHTMKDSNIKLRQIGSLSNAEFQNSDLFYRNQNMVDLTAIEMSSFYEVAVEAKMKDEDIQTCEFLLYEMVQLNLSPTPTITKLIMGYYLKKHRYEEVLRLFESVPAWGGYRNFLHGSMVILALTHMGRYTDAWRGAELLHSYNKFLSYDAARELYTRLNFTLLYPDSEISQINTGSKKKMSKKTKINAIATLMISLLRFHPMDVDRYAAEETSQYVTGQFLTLAQKEPEIAKAILKIMTEKSDVENLVVCMKWVEMIRKNKICIDFV